MQPRTYDAPYLEHLQGLLANTKQHSHDLLGCRPGEVVVDVGCGLGQDAAELTKTGATLIGLDLDSVLLDQARAAYGDRVDFRHCPAEATGLATGSVDKIRFDRILQHIPDHAPVLAEVERVLKPGGLMQVVDTDYLSLSLFLPDPSLERKLIDALTRRFAGSLPLRYLPEALGHTGFAAPILSVHPLLVYGFEAMNFIIRLDKVMNEEATAGRVSTHELMAWDTWKQTGQCFLSINLVIIQARRLV